MKQGGVELIAKTALKSVSLYAFAYDDAKAKVRRFKLATPENLLFYHVVWRTLTPSAKGLIRYISGRKNAGLVDMETEAFHGRQMLFLRIQTIGGQLCLVGIDMLTGMVYIQGAPGQGARTRIEIDNAKLKKTYAALSKDYALKQQIQAAFKACKEREDVSAVDNETASS
jgi:hypothetical protein